MSALDTLFAKIVQDVSELPDRNSPSDDPKMMLVTADELEDIVRGAFDDTMAEWDAELDVAKTPPPSRANVDIRQLLDAYTEAILNQEYSDKTHRPAAAKVALGRRDAIIRAFESRP